MQYQSVHKSVTVLTWIACKLSKDEKKFIYYSNSTYPKWFRLQIEVLKKNSVASLLRTTTEFLALRISSKYRKWISPKRTPVT